MRIPQITALLLTSHGRGICAAWNLTATVWNSTAAASSSSSSHSMQACMVFNVNALKHGAWEVVNIPANKTCPTRWDGYILFEDEKTVTTDIWTTIDGIAATYPVIGITLSGIDPYYKEHDFWGTAARVLPVTSDYPASYPACVHVMPERIPPPDLMSAWVENRCPCPTTRCGAGCDPPSDMRATIDFLDLVSGSYRPRRHSEHSCIPTTMGTTGSPVNWLQYSQGRLPLPASDASMCLSNIAAYEQSRLVESMKSAVTSPVTCWKRSIYQTTESQKLSTCGTLVYADAEARRMAWVLTTLLTTFGQPRRLVDPCFQQEICLSPFLCACEQLPDQQFFELCKTARQKFRRDSEHSIEKDVLAACAGVPKDIEAFQYTCMYWGSADLYYVTPQTIYPKDMCAERPDDARLSAFYAGYYQDPKSTRQSYINEHLNITMFEDKAYMLVQSLSFGTRSEACAKHKPMTISNECREQATALVNGSTLLTLNWTDVYTMRYTDEGPMRQMINIADLQEPMAWSAVNAMIYNYFQKPAGEPIYRKGNVHPGYLAFPRGFENYFPQLKGCKPFEWGLGDPVHGYDPGPVAQRPTAPRWATAVPTSSSFTSPGYVGLEAMPQSRIADSLPTLTASLSLTTQMPTQRPIQQSGYGPRTSNPSPTIISPQPQVNIISAAEVPGSLVVRLGGSSVTDLKGTTYTLDTLGLKLIKSSGAELFIPQKLLAVIGSVEGATNPNTAGSIVTINDSALQLLQEQAASEPRPMTQSELPTDAGITDSRTHVENENMAPTRTRPLIVGNSGSAPDIAGSRTEESADPQSNDEDPVTRPISAIRLASTDATTGIPASQITAFGHVASSTKRSHGCRSQRRLSALALSSLLSLIALL